MLSPQEDTLSFPGASTRQERDRLAIFRFSPRSRRQCRWMLSMLPKANSTPRSWMLLRRKRTVTRQTVAKGMPIIEKILLWRVVEVNKWPIYLPSLCQTKPLPVAESHVTFLRVLLFQVLPSSDTPRDSSSLNARSHWSVIGYDTSSRTTRTTQSCEHKKASCSSHDCRPQFRVERSFDIRLRLRFPQKPTHQLCFLQVWGVVFSLLPNLLVSVHPWSFERGFDWVYEICHLFRQIQYLDPIEARQQVCDWLQCAFCLAHDRLEYGWLQKLACCSLPRASYWRNSPPPKFVHRNATTSTSLSL
jgi:hypothetical protein